MGHGPELWICGAGILPGAPSASARRRRCSILVREIADALGKLATRERKTEARPAINMASDLLSKVGGAKGTRTPGPLLANIVDKAA